MIVHLSGRLVPLEHAAISPLDRGFIFGDGVYEGLRAEHGRVVSRARHEARLHRSLTLTGITGFDPDSIQSLVSELLDANSIQDAFIYLQITRGTPPPGAPPRERRPAPGTPPTVFAYCQAETPIRAFASPRTVRVITLPDHRWSCGHIKAISLLPNVMASLAAADAGVDDALFIRDGLVAEGTATNVFIAKNGALATPSLDSVSILAGVTRDVLCDALPEIQQRAVRREELDEADEIFLTGTRTVVASVTHLDHRPVGTGAPGAAARRALETLRAIVTESAPARPAHTLRP